MFFLVQEKELDKWKGRVQDLESENFIKEQTIRQLQEQAKVSELFPVYIKERSCKRTAFLLLCWININVHVPFFSYQAVSSACTEVTDMFSICKLLCFGAELLHLHQN